MGENSAIGWTNHTWNYWRGCEHAHLSDGRMHPGCLNCYAERGSKRNPTMLGHWGPQILGGTRVLAASNTRKAPLAWNNKARIDGQRHRVFVDSWNDMFEDWKGPIVDHRGDIMVECDCGNQDSVSPTMVFSGLPKGPIPCSASCGRPMRALTMNDLRRQMFKIIRQCDWLDFLILTKRPQNILNWWPHKSPDECAFAYLENVWIGTSVSDQRSYEDLALHLRDARMICPVRFLSIEPLLGPIQFDFTDNTFGEGINWAIIGNESNMAHRCGRYGEFANESDWWERGCQPIVEQLHQHDIPVFVKQGPVQGHVMHNMLAFPESCRFQDYPTVEVAV